MENPTSQVYIYFSFCVRRSQQRQAAQTVRELALVYHRLHQLNLVSGSAWADGVGIPGGGSTAGLSLALSAVNLGEAAGAALPPHQLADIYVGMALRLQAMLPRALHIFCRFVALRSLKHLTRQDVNIFFERDHTADVVVELAAFS